MYRFLLRPSWLLSHVLVVLLVVVLFNLGFWQLRRLDERQASNALIESRTTEEVVPVGRLVDADDAVSVGDDVRWRRVEASGTYELDEQVLLRSRSLNGQPGFWVLTPLDLASGEGTVVVNRGWVPFRAETDGSDVDIPAPEGEVAVSGLARESVGGATPAGDAQLTVDHVDLEWFDERLGPGRAAGVRAAPGAEPTGRRVAGAA
ncbi:MAG: SURF1 family protein [Acidimicrobiia bacterium]|nr:SURF1 family protein [Acidimicrobiia bacterium]